MIVHCPQLGDVAITLRSPLDPTTEATRIILDVIVQEELPMPSTTRLLPLKSLIDLLEERYNALRKSHPHPRDTAVIGVPVDQLSGLEVMLGRVSANQADIELQDLPTSAASEIHAMTAAMSRLRPLLARARQGKSTAEDLMTTLRAEPQMSIALDRLRTATAGVEIVADAGVVVKTGGQLPSRKFVAKEPVNVSVRVSGLKDDSTADLIVMGLRQSSILFDAEDIDRRVITARVPDSDAFHLLGLSFSCEMQVDLVLMLAVNITNNGLKYEATVMSIPGAEAIRSQVRSMLHEQRSLPIDDALLIEANGQAA